MVLQAFARANIRQYLQFICNRYDKDFWVHFFALPVIEVIHISLEIEQIKLLRLPIPCHIIPACIQIECLCNVVAHSALFKSLPL
jgi:hypothetical protein